MTLRDYLALHHIKQSSFATLIGTSQAAVSRYCHFRVPTVEHLVAITRATQGAVTANDFMSDEFPSYGVGVSTDAGGSGNPLADVPPSAARPTPFCEAERAADKQTSSARPTPFCEAERAADKQTSSARPTPFRKGEEGSSCTR